MKLRFASLTLALLAAATFLAPASSRAGSVLRVGSDVSYAPLEFFNGKQVRGFDYDLAAALSAQMRTRLTFLNHDFNDLPRALQHGQFDAIMSAMSDTRARERTFDFVDYFAAGSGILVERGNPHHIFNLAGLCGLNVDLQKGTSQEAAIRKASQTCEQLHLKPISILAYPTDADGLRALLAHRSVAHVSDYPVVAYLAATLNGGNAYEVAGRQFGVIPYGIAVRKSDVATRDALQRALKALVENGTYDTLLRKWRLEQGAMRAASVNAGRFY